MESLNGLTRSKDLVLLSKKAADVFAHFKEISSSGFKTLTEGQRVQFIVTQGAKGLQAQNITAL